MFAVLGQSTLPAKVSTSATVGAMGEAVVNNINYMWSVGEPVIFTGSNSDFYLTQGFHQPMICKAFPEIAGFNQTGCLAPYQLKANTTFDKYIWYQNKAVIANATSSNYFPVSDGKYKVFVGDSTGCNISSSFFEVDLSGKNIVPTITAYGDNNLDTLLISSPAATYQWYVITPSDNIHRAIVGAKDSAYIPYYNGIYYVKINTADNCVAYSSYYIVNNQGYESINKVEVNNDSTIVIEKFVKYFSHKLEIYPIPSREKVNIEYQSPSRNKVMLNFYDANGIMVHKIEINNKFGEFKTQFEHTNFPSGKYSVHLIDGDKKINKSIIFY